MGWPHQVLPTLRSVRLSLGTRSNVAADISLRTPRQICVRLFPLGSGGTNGAGAGRCLLFSLDFPVTVQKLPPTQDGSLVGAGPATRIVEARFVIDADTFGNGLHKGAGASSDSSDERALSSLYCGSCNSVLVQEGTLRRVLPLPSPFWYELADMWICHDDFKCRSEMANKTPADLRPHPGDCFFADYHLMLHARDFVPGAIKWALEDDDDDDAMEVVVEAECGGPAGGPEQLATLGAGEAASRDAGGTVGEAAAARPSSTSGPRPDGGIPRLSSSTSSASSVASFSPLGRGRLWEEVSGGAKEP